MKTIKDIIELVRNSCYKIPIKVCCEGSNFLCCYLHALSEDMIFEGEYT